MSTDGGVDKGVRLLSLGGHIGIPPEIGDDIDRANIDGGGPGTYSQLLIIKEYMVRLANDLGLDEEDVYPADYFDLMGGVGFGGLVAILLGHLCMNVDEATEALMDVASAVFPNGSQPEYDAETRTGKLRDSVMKILQSRGIPPDRKMQEKGEKSRGCKVALYAATTADLNHPIVLRNYRPRVSSLNPAIIDALCATMAAPPYFSAIKIGARGREQVFVGGPRGAHNPTRELLKEASAIFGKDKLVIQIISLGCGRSHVSSMERNTNSEGSHRSVQEMVMDCETVAKDLSTRFYEMDAYLRLDVERGMANLIMNQWDNLGSIATHTSAYVGAAEISDTLEASLRCLQGGAGTIKLGEINNPKGIKDVQDERAIQKEDLDRALRSVKDHEDYRHLARLKPVDAPSYDESRSCMKDTRQFILSHIMAWTEHTLERNKPSDNCMANHIFWLYGSPGLGKTSVANSLCRQLHKAGNLGGSFFCRRDDPILSDPTRVLLTLLYKLAWIWTPYRDLVVHALREDPNLNADWTGCQVLLGHLYSLQYRPQTALVIVIDALDESGDPQTRVPLLKCLSEICVRIEWLKTVVTCRPEHDISSFLQELGLIGHDLSKDDQAHNDILLFTRSRMASLAKEYHLSSDWPGEARLEAIARRSGGLFIFVETLYKLLDDSNPELLLTQVPSGTLGEANAELHNLYSTAIATRIRRCREDFRLFVQALVAMATHQPLPDQTFASLIGLEPQVISSWVDKLSSLLYRDVSENGGIRVRHLSVIEFFTDPTCPQEFRVDLPQANDRLGYRCLITMRKELEFNICELETSCILNIDIQDLDERVQRKISGALQYSCMHWSSYLCSNSIPPSKENSELLHAILTGPQLLYWLEVLSLMGKVSAGILALRRMKQYCKKLEDGRLPLVEEALRFMLAFFTPISTSAPHIYISTLSFTPMESRLWNHISAAFSERFRVCKGRMGAWPDPSGIWYGHTDDVLSVSCSPDGQNVASGSSDGTIRIWDTQTGRTVGEPLRGHTGYVYSVAYSPDGRNIISGSYDGTIRIWNAETREAAGQPLRGHAGSVSCVRYSPDGGCIISGSDDMTIRIWDAQTGEGYSYSTTYSPDNRNIIFVSSDMTIHIWNANTGAAVGGPLSEQSGYARSATYSPDGWNVISCSSDVTIQIRDARTGVAVGQPLRGHTDSVNSVVYSPNGQNIVSCSNDMTIRIWDAQTGAAVGEPLRGHTSAVNSVAYTPDGRGIISGSSDRTIRIWDAHTGAPVEQSPRERIGWICSVAYSPDGLNVVSGSFDKTIQIWDAQTGSAVGRPFRGHTGSVNSVVYSPDGRRIASASNDMTIQIWDAQTGAAVRGPLRGHVDYVQSVAYSPDGQNIVSGSDDRTIRIWDMQTGSVMGEPLRGHIGSVRSVAYSPDGRNIVSGSHDRTIRIWNAQTGGAEGQPLRGHTGPVNSVMYSSDGRRITSCSNDMTIRIWDAQTEAAVGGPLRGHVDYVQSVVYSPDGQHIISCSYDRTIRIWDAQTGAAVAEALKGHSDYICSIAYSPDGWNIVSGSYDRTIRIWDARANIGTDNPQMRHNPVFMATPFSPHDYGVHSEHKNLSSNQRSLNAFSGRSIPARMLNSNGWVHSEDGILFWVPEDCRQGLTCDVLTTIPKTESQRCVRIDFTNFQYGVSWTNVRRKSPAREY